MTRPKESVEKHGGLDPAAFDTLCGRSGGESLASIGLARPDGHIVVRVGIDGGDNV
jgi:hypothetical protein